MSSQSLGLKFGELFVSEDRLSLTWRGNFVEEYYLKWPCLGSADRKYIIPRQYVQHLQLGYSLENGRYNINLECSNITDAKAYDHFRLQKPGRAFQIKFHTSLTNSKTINANNTHDTQQEVNVSARLHCTHRVGL